MPDMQTQIPAVPILVPLALILLLTAWLRFRDRLLAASATALYLTAVAGVTLLPLQIATGIYANQIPWYEKGNFIPVLTIDPVTFVLNIVMFVPFGFLLPLLVPSQRHRIVLLSLAFSAGIEAVQFATNIAVSSGRTADVNDLLANTLGGVLGLLALRTARRILASPAASRQAG